MRLDEKFVKKVMTGGELKAIAQYAICASGFYHREGKAEQHITELVDYLDPRTISNSGQEVICLSESHHHEKA
jgi:hypothetical protein